MKKREKKQKQTEYRNMSKEDEYINNFDQSRRLRLNALNSIPFGQEQLNRDVTPKRVPDKRRKADNVKTAGKKGKDYREFSESLENSASEEFSETEHSPENYEVIEFSHYTSQAESSNSKENTSPIQTESSKNFIIPLKKKQKVRRSKRKKTRAKSPTEPELVEQIPLNYQTTGLTNIGSISVHQPIMESQSNLFNNQASFVQSHRPLYIGNLRNQMSMQTLYNNVPFTMRAAPNLNLQNSDLQSQPSLRFNNTLHQAYATEVPTNPSMPALQFQYSRAKLSHKKLKNSVKKFSKKKKVVKSKGKKSRKRKVESTDSDPDSDESLGESGSSKSSHSHGSENSERKSKIGRKKVDKKKLEREIRRDLIYKETM